MSDEANREEVIEQLQQTHEHIFDPATAKPILHNWVDRGLKFSCEGAGHANHEAWKTRKPMQQ